jgi:putative ABC transport system permease protein
MASIARRNLIEDLPRFLVAQAGIMFAVSLVTLQTGLYRGFSQSVSDVIDKSRADIWLASDTLVHLQLGIPLTYETKAKAAKVSGVDRAEVLLLQGVDWRDAQNQLSGVTLVAFEEKSQLFSPWNVVQGTVDQLSTPYTVMADTASLKTLGVTGTGESGTIGMLPARVMGLTRGTKSLVLGNLMFTSLTSALAYLSSRPERSLPCGLAANGVDCKAIDYPKAPRALKNEDPVDFILIRAKTGENLKEIKQALEASISGTRAYTRKELSAINQVYWQERSGIGFVLGLGAVVGILVGVVVVGQILYSSIAEHLKEFGTLKAMGASNWVIYGVIGEQALWMSVLGYLPGMAICWGVAKWAASTQGILILITPLSAVSIFGITVLMCLGASLFAIQKVTQVDPAIVFKS